MTTILDRLGLPDDCRAVIIVADGLGSTNAANRAIARGMHDGVLTSAGLQVPCPWSRAAVADHRDRDVGVSLTVNAEHPHYRWGPITMAPSLLDGNGGFPATPTDLWEHADIGETRRECRAQIERALLWGFDVTHLSAHLGALCSRPEFFDLYCELALEFELPISLPDPSVDLGFDARSLATAEGIVVPDREVAAPVARSARADIEATLLDLQPGVTELHVRPAAESDEIRAVTEHWTARVADAHLVTNDWAFRVALERLGVRLIGYRELRTAQRAR